MTRDRLDPSRRAWLGMLGRGVLGTAAGGAAWAMPARRALAQQAPGGGMRRIEGRVTVNGREARVGMPVAPGAIVETGPGAMAVFVVNRDAFLLRAGGRLETSGNTAVELMRLLTGALLSVLGPGNRRMETRNATLGVRGTALYVESEPDRTYVCTCYGTVDLRSADNPPVRETVTTRYHDAPRYIHSGAGSPERIIVKAPVINHTDAELILLESLVGREPPFLGPGYQQRY